MRDPFQAKTSQRRRRHPSSDSGLVFDVILVVVDVVVLVVYVAVDFVVFVNISVDNLQVVAVGGRARSPSRSC